MNIAQSFNFLIDITPPLCSNEIKNAFECNQREVLTFLYFCFSYFIILGLETEYKSKRTLPQSHL